MSIGLGIVLINSVIAKPPVAQPAQDASVSSLIEQFEAEKNEEIRVLLLYSIVSRSRKPEVAEFLERVAENPSYGLKVQRTARDLLLEIRPKPAGEERKRQPHPSPVFRDTSRLRLSEREKPSPLQREKIPAPQLIWGFYLAEDDEGRINILGELNREASPTAVWFMREIKADDEQNPAVRKTAERLLGEFSTRRGEYRDKERSLLESWRLNYKLLSLQLGVAAFGPVGGGRNQVPRGMAAVSPTAFFYPAEYLTFGAKLYLFSTVGFGVNQVGNFTGMDEYTGRGKNPPFLSASFENAGNTEFSWGVMSPTVPLSDDNQWSFGLFGEYNFGRHYDLYLNRGVQKGGHHWVGDSRFMGRIDQKEYLLGVQFLRVGSEGDNTIGFRAFSRHRNFEARKSMYIPSDNSLGLALVLDLSLLQIFR